MLLKRSIAFTFDLILLSLAYSAITVPLGLTLSDSGRFLILLTAMTAYFTFFLWRWNGLTPGSRIVGLRVAHPSHARLPFRYALLRAAGVEISYLMLGLGFTLSLVRLDRRTLPDLISGTDVRRRR